MTENKNKISIMCPNCRKFLLKANADDQRKNKMLCKNCKKLITYTPYSFALGDSSTYKISDKPERTTASGCRFY